MHVCTPNESEMKILKLNNWAVLTVIVAFLLTFLTLQYNILSFLLSCLSSEIASCLFTVKLWYLHPSGWHYTLAYECLYRSLSPCSLLLTSHCDICNFWWHTQLEHATVCIAVVLPHFHTRCKYSVVSRFSHLKIFPGHQLYLRRLGIQSTAQKSGKLWQYRVLLKLLLNWILSCFCLTTWGASKITEY